MRDDAGLTVIGGARAALGFVAAGVPATLVAASVYAAAAALGGEAAARADGPAGAVFWLSAHVIVLAGAAVFAAAVLRAATAPAPASATPKFGADEARLFATFALTALVLVFIAALGFLSVVMVTLAFLAASGADAGTDIQGADAMFSAIGPFGRVGVATTLLGTAGVLIYTAARLSTAPAATIVERKVQIFATWERTAGRALPIVLAGVLAALPGLAAAVAVRWGLGAIIGDAPALGPRLLADAAAAFADASVLGVALSALSAYVYRRTAPPAAAAHDGDAP